MFRYRIFLFVVFLTCLFQSGYSQPFDCDGRLILSTVTNSTSNNSINFGSFGIIFFSPNAIYFEESFDAIGFNTRDNYIYGVKVDTDSIVRLKVDGSYDPIGTVSGSGNLRAFAGDCAPDGTYLLYDSESNKIQYYDVIGNFGLTRELDLFWDPESVNAGPLRTRLNDIVIDPNNANVAYSFQGRLDGEEYGPDVTRGYMHKINLDFSSPDVGMVTPLFEISEDLVVDLGSLFFRKEGDLYGVGPRQVEPFLTNLLIRIDLDNESANQQGQGDAPLGAISDGCSCPYSMTFENDINPRDVSCNNSTINFLLSIKNGSNLTLTDVIFRDTVPEGTIIDFVSGDYNGNIEPGTGVGFDKLTITDLRIEPGETVNINIRANVIDLPVDLVYNQGHLSNLPALLGGTMASDEPSSPDFTGDVSGFSSTAIELEDVEFAIKKASNCLDANDSEVRISSPQLLAGEEYEIKLINQDWEDLFFNVTINNSNTFQLDSLLPGEYNLKQIRPISSRCNFAWKETELVVEPPNELLQASASTNSPICDGFELALNGSMSPLGTIHWSGPDRFTSTEFSPRIPSATDDYTGIFEMVANYGFCEQIRPLDILVTPKIEAAITGKLDYCEREIVELTATGNGDLKGFSWSGPLDFVSGGQEMVLPIFSPDQSGTYEVIIDNGLCTDTTSTIISALPSPTINNLPGLIETDFCTPLKLTPVITGDDQVSYSWSRRSGLDCYDCPSPTLQIPFLPSYQLTVINDYMCTDTSTVQVVLDKEQLVYIPNAFSPNFDGRNDYFQLSPNCGINQIRNLEIYNRWGSMVYKNDEIDALNPQEFWDGKIGGEKAPPGVYIWQVELDLVDGTTLRYFGDISLVR